MARPSDGRQVGTEGLALFARATDPETSHLAAASMRSAAHGQRLAILEYLKRCGEYAATADATDLALGWRSGRAGRRYGELVALGLVQVASATRKTSTGREAQTYVLPIFAA